MEYLGIIPSAERPAAMERLQNAINELIQQSLAVDVKSVKYEDIADNCGGSCPSYMPKGKDARIVTFEGIYTFFLFDGTALLFLYRFFLNKEWLAVHVVERT